MQLNREGINIMANDGEGIMANDGEGISISIMAEQQEVPRTGAIYFVDCPRDFPAGPRKRAYNCPSLQNLVS